MQILRDFHTGKMGHKEGLMKEEILAFKRNIM